MDRSTMTLTAAVCLAGFATAGEKARNTDVKTAGPVSITLRKPERPAVSGKVSEEKVVMTLLKLGMMRLEGEDAQERAREIETVMRRSYREMNKDKRFAKIPSAMQTALAGRDGKPLHYYLYVPRSAGKARRPLVVMLHGGGGNLKLSFHMASRVAEKHGFVLVRPTYGNGTWWTKKGAAFVREVLADVKRRCEFDEKRMAVAGVSNGGTGAWHISRKLPGTFSAVISISGAFNLSQAVKFSEGPPLYIVHGAKDRVIPAKQSREAYVVLKKRPKTIFREYPDGDHFVAVTRHREIWGGIRAWLGYVWQLKEWKSAAPEESAGPAAGGKPSEDKSQARETAGEQAHPNGDPEPN
jgi:predicted esterase